MAVPACKSVPLCFNPSVWFDASNPLGDQTQPSNGASITDWKDLSGNNSHAVQATAANQPTYATNAVNSKPVVSFDGVDDFMDSANGLLGLTTNATMIYVASFGNVTTQNATVISSTPDDASNRIDTAGPYLAGTSQYIFDFGVAGGAGRIAGAFTEAKDTYYSFTYYVNSATPAQTVYVNNSSKYNKATATSTFTPGTKTLRLCRFAASAAYTLGKIAEILIFPRALSTTEMASVYAYLKGKYALP